MKHIFRFLLAILTLTAVAVSCNETPEDKDLVLTPNKTTIDADGADKVIFTVKYGEEDVTANAEINIQSAQGTKLSSNEFTTTDAGEYKFTASYKDKTSSEITVTAMPSVKLILSVDKPVIVANDIDEAVFTVMLDGVDVTENSNVCMVNGACLVNPVFITSEAGEYVFYATLKDGDGTDKSNEITVNATAVPIGDFDAGRTIQKNVAYFTFTATWCEPCYKSKTNLKAVMDEYPDNIVQVNLYTHDSHEKVKTTLSGTLGTQLLREGRFFISEYPTTITELRERAADKGKVPTEAQIRDAYKKFAAYPARTGIKVNSAINDGKIDVTVTVGAKEADTYFVGIFLVEDNIMAPQSGSDGDYNHTDVLRAVGMASIFGDELGRVGVGETMSKEYSFNVLDNYNTDNLYLVVYTLYEDEGSMVISNTVKSRANGLTGFKYVD